MNTGCVRNSLVRTRSAAGRCPTCRRFVKGDFVAVIVGEHVEQLLDVGRVAISSSEMPMVLSSTGRRLNFSARAAARTNSVALPVLDGNGVEEVVGLHFQAEPTQALGEQHPSGD